MAQTISGARKIAAAKAGITIEQYEAKVASGEKWCTGCKEWHVLSMFGQDASRGDGLAAACLAQRRALGKALYRPAPPLKRGRSFVPARDGDRLQARRRVNYFVEAGLLPRPTDLPCSDCGHIWAIGQKRHEYDHFLGYSAEHHEHVEAVCSTCHHIREARRKA